MSALLKTGTAAGLPRRISSDNLVEDHKIRTELKAQLKDVENKIEIERTVDPSTSAPRVTVNIYCAKPGMVIGKGGEERVALQEQADQGYGKTVIVNVIEVKSAATNAQLVAEDIARQLENRVTFRRAMKQCMRNAMSPRDRATVPAKGIKAGPSAVWAARYQFRAESYHEGDSSPADPALTLTHGFAEAATTCGRIGVKVWVYKGEVLKSAKTAQKKEGRQQVMLLPQRKKYRRVQRGRMTGKATRGNVVCQGQYGLVALEPAWISSTQIEAARVAMTRYIKRGGKVWIKIFPDKPVTEKPAETRMGSGKGSPEYWVAVVKPGRVLFELADVDEATAREALRLAMHKLPIKCKFVVREDSVKEDGTNEG